MADKIKTTGKKLPKVNQGTVTSALGASEIIKGPYKAEDGRLYFEITFQSTRENKRVFSIGKREVDEYKLLGESEGQSFSHCLLIATRVDNFFERVCAFRFVKPTAPEHAVCIVFYEEKE